MIITLVMDSYDDLSNGITITTRRLAEVLTERGHQVQIVAASVNDKNPNIIAYPLGYRKTPVLYQVSKSQGFFFAKKNKKMIKEAILRSDIVHFLLPFKIEKYAQKLCMKHNIISTAAFHLQPENITSTLMLNYRPFNDMIYAMFRKFYNQFDYVHCPSVMIKEQLLKHKYKADLKVISNGVAPIFKRLELKKPKHLQDKFIILMIGRLSAEKRQDLIIEAVKHSKYEKNIQIVFAGKGPLKSYYEKLGEDLTNKIEFGFYSPQELVQIINLTDLYIHASDAEIEAISCIEAFSCGAVPIISDSPLSATNQFALDEKNLFKQGSWTDLLEKIEFWYENPNLKQQRSSDYLKYSEQFRLESCVDKLEEMFNEAIKAKEAI